MSTFTVKEFLFVVAILQVINISVCLHMVINTLVMKKEIDYLYRKLIELLSKRE